MESLSDMIIYHVLLDRFAKGGDSGELPPQDGPVFCGGDLEGVRERLDYIRSLGANTIWLSPFNTTTAYHGYHITDLFGVDPRFGTLEDLKRLIDDAHGHGMKVIMDFVPNHVSREHPFFLDAQRNRYSKYHEWFYWESWPDEYLCFMDFTELVKLNLDHPGPRTHVIEAARFWLDQGIDGMRLDHVIGCSHDFWHAFVTELKEHKPGAFFVGEAAFGTELRHYKTLRFPGRYMSWLKGVLGNNIQLDIMKKYIAVLDGLMDFEFKRILLDGVAHGNYSEEEVRSQLAGHYAQFPDDFLLVSFLDNQDSHRFLFEAGQDKERLKTAARIQFSQPQPKVIYYGSEIGMTHHKSFADFSENWDLIVRQPMQWAHMDEDLLAFYKQLSKAPIEKTTN